MPDLDFPRAIDAIGPEWLTRKLHGSGALSAGGRVARIVAEPLGQGVGFVSAMQRLRPVYEGDAAGAPASLIAKVSPVDPSSRQVGEIFRFYQKETGFYARLADRTPVRTPRAFGVDYDPSNMDFVLLLEDMSPARMPDQVEGLNLDDAGRAIDAAAGLHGAWWGSPELPGMDWLLTLNSPEMKALEPVYQQCWPAVVNFIGDRMSPYARRAGEALAPRIGALMDLAFEQPRTLMHGDFRADNMMFEAGSSSAPFALVDWQIVMQGPAAFDLAYMLSGSLDVETRRAGQGDLIARHHDGLVRAGVGDYSLSQAREAFRICAMLAWCWPVVAIGSLDFDNPRGLALFHAWAERALALFEDVDGAAVIP
jgi:hypothetical protein